MTTKQVAQKSTKYLTALGVYILTILGMSFIGATMIHKELLNEEHIGFCASVVLFIAAAAGTWCDHEKNFMRFLLKSAGYITIILLLTVLVFGGQFNGIKKGSGDYHYGMCICLFAWTEKRR